MIKHGLILPFQCFLPFPFAKVSPLCRNFELPAPAILQPLGGIANGEVMRVDDGLGNFLP